jgi:hypothetical protein
MLSERDRGDVEGERKTTCRGGILPGTASVV